MNNQAEKPSAIKYGQRASESDRQRGAAGQQARKEAGRMRSFSEMDGDQDHIAKKKIENAVPPLSRIVGGISDTAAQMEWSELTASLEFNLHKGH